MKTCCRFWMIGSVAVVISAGIMGSQQRNEKADKEPQPPEFKVLGKLVETWGPATNNFKAMKAKWTVGSKYIQQERSTGVVSPARGSDEWSR